MWTILLKCVLWGFYFLAIFLFIRGLQRYKISFWWVLVMLLLPIGMVPVYEWYRNKSRTANSPAATNNTVNILFAVVSYAALLTPGIMNFYNAMDGAPLEPLAETNKIAAISLLVVIGLYACYRIIRQSAQR